MKETVPGSESIPGRPDTTAPDGRPVIHIACIAGLYAVSSNNGWIVAYTAGCAHANTRQGAVRRLEDSMLVSREVDYSTGRRWSKTSVGDRDNTVATKTEQYRRSTRDRC